MDQRAYLFDPRLNADRGVLRGYTLPDVIDRTVRNHGASLAVIDGDVRLSWSQLADRAEALAAGLQDRGIGQGDVVGLHLANGWEFILAVVALAQLGAVALALHPPYRTRELQQLIEWTQAVAIIAPASALTKVREVAAQQPSLATLVITGDAAGIDPGGPPALSFAALASTDAGRVPRAAITPEDPLSLNPTSGTESLRPKICMHSHDGLLSNSMDLAVRARLTKTDRVLCTGGYTHLFGMASLQMALHVGATVVCLPQFSPAVWLDLCERESVTRAWTVPAHLADIIEEQRLRPRKLALTELRTGGVAIEPGFAATVRAVLCNNFVIQWGTSEIGGGATTLAQDVFSSPTIGTPIENAAVRIVDENGDACSAGVAGEIWYRRADSFRGYLRDPETTAAAVTRDGWVRTGDIAVREADGSLAFRGRTKDIINRGGLKISAFEVESLLAQLRPLRQIAVVATPDPRLGERATLVCSLHAGHTLELHDVTRHLDGLGAAKYKWPEALIVLDELPTTATGKVAKAAVRAFLAAPAEAAR